jgi:hypothetical protein
MTRRTVTEIGSSGTLRRDGAGRVPSRRARLGRCFDLFTNDLPHRLDGQRLLLQAHVAFQRLVDERLVPDPAPPGLIPEAFEDLVVEIVMR